MANPNWVDGKSGNPGGRPKMSDTMRAAFGRLSEEAIKALEAIVTGVEEGVKPADKLRAAEIILDRHLGKPVQSIEADVHDSRATVDTSKLTPEQRDALAALAVSSLEG